MKIGLKRLHKNKYLIKKMLKESSLRGSFTTIDIAVKNVDWYRIHNLVHFGDKWPVKTVRIDNAYL